MFAVSQWGSVRMDEESATCFFRYTLHKPPWNWFLGLEFTLDKMR